MNDDAVKQCRGMVLSLIFVSAPLCAHAEAQFGADVIETAPNGEVNWTSGWARATGTGYGPNNAPATLSQTLGERAGYSLALRNLLEVIKGVRVDSESLVQGHMRDNDVVKVKVSGLVQGAQIVRSSIKQDGGIEVQVKAPLWGIDSGAFISTFRKPGLDIPSDATTATVHTQVVVDARGLSMTPALFPRIVNEKGHEVYSASKVDPTVLDRAGPAKYLSLSRDIDLESHYFPRAYVVRPVRLADDRLPLNGPMPITMRATDTVGTMRSTLVISSEDFGKLQYDEMAIKALRRANVIIVMDPLMSGGSQK
jgi:hypothetical protein